MPIGLIPCKFPNRIMLMFLKIYLCIKKVVAIIFIQRDIKSHFFQKFSIILIFFLYICLVISGCVKNNRKLPCGKPLFWDKTLTHYLHRTMSMWVQYDKPKESWIHHTRNRVSRTQDVPPYSHYTNRPLLKLPLARLKILVPQLFSNSWIPYHHKFFIVFRS